MTRSPSPIRLCLALALAGCAALPAEIPEDVNDDPVEGTLPSGLAESGRWTPPADVRAAGEAQYVAYEGAPSWSGGANCSGTFGSGTRRLGEYLVANFGANRFDGYNCRQNTANTSKTSMHGTGRAIDVFVPLSGGAADNTVGDPIANWLIRHAEEIGVQFIIWDRGKWNGSYSGRKDRAYGGPHPHHDHLHVELTRAGSRGETPWFGGGTATPPDTPSSPSSPTGEPSPYVGTACGTGGSCIDTNVSSCSGDLLIGACPGPNNIRCCVGGSPSSSDPTPSDPPPSDPEPSEPAPSEPSDPGSDPSDPGAGDLCTNFCWWAFDGECDDGGPGSLYSVCEYGTDCGDCGPR